MTRTPSRRWALRSVVVAALAALLPLTPVSAYAATSPVALASLVWGLNGTSQGAAPNGGCDYFVAGKSDGTAATYKTQDGDVYVVKESSTGVLSPATSENRCQVANGSSIGQRLYFSGGDGQRDTATGAVTISWDGAATVNAYGGLAPWYLEDPVLTLDASGNGTVKADVGGYASSMSNPNVKEPLAPRPDVTIATVSGADVSSGTGVTIDPVYAGVDYFPITDGLRSASSAISPSAKAANPAWGSWPEPFVDFQYETGLSTYWHTSGGAADPKKPPMPVQVTYASSVPEFAEVPASIKTPPTNLQAVIGDDVAFEVEALGTDLRYQWQKRNPETSEFEDLAGETSSTLTFEDVTTAQSGQLFKVRVSNSGGDVTSGTVELRVEAAAAPAVVADPATLLLPEGGTEFFGGAASGYPDPTYQWETSTNGTTWSDIGTPSTTQGLKVEAAELDQDGSLYRFRAFNGHGTPAVSAAADLRVVPLAGDSGVVVLPGTRVDPAVANSLSVIGGGFPTTTPGFIIVAVADTATFNAASPPAPNTLSAFALVGSAPYNAQATGTFKTTVNIPAARLDPAKSYAVVTYTYPTASAAFATSTPLDFGATTPLVVSGQPSNASADVGGSATFTATVDGAPAPTALRWQLDNGSGWKYLDGQTGATLTLTGLTLADAGTYRLVATRGADKVVTDAATLTVTVPAIAGAPTPRITGPAIVGRTVRAVPGTWPTGTALTYQWYADATPIAAARSSSLVVPRGAAGKTLKVTVTGKRAGNVATTRTSPATLRAASVGTVKISGKAKVGRTLRAVPKGWTPGAKITYTWRIGSKVVTTSKPTYKLKASAKGKKVRVTVVVAKAGHTKVTGQSGRTKKVAKR